ncbi:MAG: AlpA family phage regulatory protein [Proteobacteria bacterium]|nr:AlpA family phage regulatory protein [Pseudomonadota bacterium]
MTSLGRSAIYARIARGEFPAPRQISARCSVWSVAEIVEWMDRQPRQVGPRPGARAAAAAP